MGSNGDNPYQSPADEIGYNPFEPGFAENPYEQYDRLRESARTHRTPWGALVLHRYDDCFAALRQPGTSVQDGNADVSLRNAIPADLLEGRQRRGRHAILNLDPPDHTRIRRLVSGTFTVRRLEGLRPRVRELVDGLLDDLAETGGNGEPVDLVSRYAFPLPFQVIGELLGMPDGDRNQLRTWSHRITRFLEPFTERELMEEAVVASDHMTDYIEDAIHWKRANPGDDLLSALIAAEEDGDKLSNVELVDQVRLFYIAGHETTVNLIGNGVLALLRHRDQYDRLLADPSLDANAVDELLRWDSPVQISRRIALTDTELGGEVAKPGQMIFTLLGAANHDPDHWGPTVGRLDLGRTGAGAHLSFGSGIHHCLGAALARLEGVEAIGALVRRFPEMDLEVDPPVYNGRVVLRGLDALEVSLGA